ncbi:MAG: hypothetical protein SFU53_16275 [Terrimicrobiaceae bacterium]|nr:hypothetical protein [Terrimicrobiaceae bacterium]
MDVRSEARAILDLFGGDFPRAIELVHRQMDVLHSRAQVLTGLAGIVVTVTGFSGRLIAATNRPAQVLVIAGLAVVLVSAFYIVCRVMQIRWVTAELGGDPVETITRVLIRRDAKTAAIRRGGIILFSGLVLYFVAFALMLLNPEPLAVPVR